MAFARLILMWGILGIVVPAFAPTGYAAEENDDEPSVDLLYPRLEEKGIIVRGHMKANVRFLPGPFQRFPLEAQGYLITADGPYWGLPPEAYFCDGRIAEGHFDENLPTLCEKLPGIGWQVREMVLFRSTTRRRTIAGDDNGFLNLIDLTLSGQKRAGVMDSEIRYEITSVLGRYEIYGRPKPNGERREMWFDLREARNPFIRRGPCSRIIAMVGLMMETRSQGR